MPRKPAAAKPGAGRQSTLSFNTKVTKSVPKSAKELAASSTPATKKEVAPTPVKPEPEPVELPPKTEDVEEVKAESEPEVEKSEAELRAEKISDAQIGRYWRSIENARMSKPVHQDDLDVGEKILRYFDVCSQYGPSIGKGRLKRWERAERLGLNPPIEVLAVLVRQEDKGSGKGYDKAQIDELLNPSAAEAAE